MDRTIKIAAALLVVVILGCAVFILSSFTSPLQSAASAGRSPDTGNVTVYFFYGEECPHCYNVMPIILSLKEKYPDADFRILETWHNAKNQALYTSLNKKLGVTYAAVPEAIVGNVVLFGERDIPARLESVILEQLKRKS
jgi:thiol-disulfide isomerase/thioredoxin